MAATVAECWTPSFSSWRHGGWYVDNVRYPSGAVGCVSRNYADKKWRIVCDERPGSFPGGDNDHTYPNRNAAAQAEREVAEAKWTEERERYGFSTYRTIAEALPDDVLRDVSRHALLNVTLHVALTDVARERDVWRRRHDPE